MFNAKITITAALILPLTFHGVNAQITTRRRRTSVGGVVAGIVVGCLVLLALLVLCCFLSRRRRRLRNNPAGFAGGPGAGNYNGRTGGRPLFGNGGMFAFGKQNYNQDQTLPQHQQPVGGAQYGYGNNNPNSYAGQNGVGGETPGNANQMASPPPPYGKEGAGFAPPPGPPPPAHTTGAQNDQFVGGFRT
ncbi:hypothetical protein F5050DRAFT_1048614 [Lentinula boryana]|uniref:Uncharacterized protein n=1 Tax=Lentinula boryana TaxID=40481 RepID=A0ABQ8Q0I0_9AGAR|nr:hypothetical protein F5050DRAFT_1048614 [Lentinula boryana]